MGDKKIYFTAVEVAKILGVSKGHAYKLIQKLNNELSDKGYLVVAGKIPVRYSTRNQRLAAIRSLFHYIQKDAPEYMFQCHQIIGILFKKAEKRVIGFLNEEKTKELLAAPRNDTLKGLRDQALLCLLYDSGARVQELADIRIRDLHLDSPAQVQLTGKGRKTRSVPLMEQTVRILEEYIKRNGLDNGLNADHPLFYNAQKKKLTRQGITYVLKKYAEQCGINDISSHQLRHTKAMHITEADVNPIFISNHLIMTS